MESGAGSRRKKLSRNKDPKRDFPRRCPITLMNSIFIIAMMPLNPILRKCMVRYKLSRSQEKMHRYNGSKTT